MKKLFLVAVMLSIGATAMAAQTTKAAAKPAAAHTRMTTSHASGIVEKYDAATRTLTVKHDGKDMQFVVADTTSVMKGKDKADLAGATGMEAKIEYKVSGATKTADRIELSTVKTAAAKPTKK